MPRTIELRLHARQYDFVFSTVRFAFYVGGRGAGKSFAGALRAIFATQVEPGGLGLVGAPTHPMLRDAAQRTFFDLCPPSLIRRHNKTEQRTVMRNGSEILWRSLDQEQRTRGLNLAPRCIHTIAEYGAYAYACSVIAPVLRGG